MQYIKQRCHLSEPSKSGIQNTAKATSDFVGNKIANKITCPKFQGNSGTVSQTQGKSTEIPKKRYISLEKREQVINQLNLIKNSKTGISKNNKFVENRANQPSKFRPASACNVNKKETLIQVFSCELCKISKNNFFTEHLWTTASDTCEEEGNCCWTRENGGNKISSQKQ